MKKKTRVLITAGPTREYIDPVRYLSNDSSGRMGFALAAAASRMGFRVTLVAGPVELPTPPGVKRLNVVSAREMQLAALEHAKRSDLVVMAAAVADYRPAGFSRVKIKRREGKRRSIDLVENPDILAGLCRERSRNSRLTTVGFALETDNLEKNALKKLARKGCDWIVANAASSIGSAASKATLLCRDGRRVKLPILDKEELAVVILSHVLS